MAEIDRCANCKIGTSFCVYSKTIAVKNMFGKELQIVPNNNCIIGLEDEYALWPDTELNYIADHTAVMKYRECEFNDPFSTDIFKSNLYLWESVSNNITTGDNYEIDGRRFEYDHPLYHIIDYNVPINKSGKVRLTENCHVMGIDDIHLVSAGWHEDDGGEAKKAIGIPRVRKCVGLYGTYDPKTGMTMHKSMKDWTSRIRTFKNYTNVVVSKYTPAKYNLFIDDFKIIDEYVRSLVSNPVIVKRIYEAFDLIMKGKYLNVYKLLINNNVSNDTAKAITNNISTKDPASVYKNNEGYRYNIHKVEALYFNIVKDIIKIDIGKKEILANIVNFVLNDNELMNHVIGSTKKLNKYIEWYDSVVDTLDPEFADELHPKRQNFNEYNSDNFSDSAFRIIRHAIANEHLLTIDDLPNNFKIMRKNYLKYMAEYIEPNDILEIGAATLNLKEFLNPADDNIYNQFKRFVIHFDRIKPIEIKEIWEKFEYCYKNNDATAFWDYIEDESTSIDLDEDTDIIDDKFNYQKLIELYTGEDIFDLESIEFTHGSYIRIRQKRYYDKRNQERELMKMLDPFEEKFTDDRECDVVEFDDTNEGDENVSIDYDC